MQPLKDLRMSFMSLVQLMKSSPSARPNHCTVPAPKKKAPRTTVTNLVVGVNLDEVSRILYIYIYIIFTKKNSSILHSYYFIFIYVYRILIIKFTPSFGLSRSNSRIFQASEVSFFTILRSPMTVGMFLQFWPNGSSTLHG